MLTIEHQYWIYLNFNITSHVVCILLTKRLSKDSKGFEPFSLFFQNKSIKVAVRDYNKKVVVISYK